jgi:NADPH:quinone reductase-like Zn-dependent oxidoreductase
MLNCSFSTATRNTDDESAHQQYALFEAAPQYTVKIPEDISFDEASTLPTAFNTAQVALYDPSGFGFPNPFTDGNKFGKGKVLFVAGGSSVIGLAGLPPIRTD